MKRINRNTGLIRHFIMLFLFMLLPLAVSAQYSIHLAGYNAYLEYNKKHNINDKQDSSQKIKIAGTLSRKNFKKMNEKVSGGEKSKEKASLSVHNTLKEFPIKGRSRGESKDDHDSTGILQLRIKAII
jgi:hypothetical protein